MEFPLSIVVFGATGDLAKKKIFPALYQLILLKHFPKSINIVGYARSRLERHEFFYRQCSNIKEKAGLNLTEFYSQVTYFEGGYDDPDAFLRLDVFLTDFEGGRPGNRLFFLSIPPFVFGSVCQCISQYARGKLGGFTHLVIEKPFGRDSSSFEELNQFTSSLFKESELFRIDHYLGRRDAESLVASVLLSGNGSAFVLVCGVTAGVEAAAAS